MPRKSRARPKKVIKVPILKLPEEREPSRSPSLRQKVWAHLKHKEYDVRDKNLVEILVGVMQTTLDELTHGIFTTESETLIYAYYLFEYFHSTGVYGDKRRGFLSDARSPSVVVEGEEEDNDDVALLAAKRLLEDHDRDFSSAALLRIFESATANYQHRANFDARTGFVLWTFTRFEEGRVGKTDLYALLEDCVLCEGAHIDASTILDAALAMYDRLDDPVLFADIVNRLPVESGEFETCAYRWLTSSASCNAETVKSVFEAFGLNGSTGVYNVLGLESDRTTRTMLASKVVTFKMWQLCDDGDDALAFVKALTLLCDPGCEASRVGYVKRNSNDNYAYGFLDYDEFDRLLKRAVEDGLRVPDAGDFESWMETNLDQDDRNMPHMGHKRVMMYLEGAFEWLDDGKRRVLEQINAIVDPRLTPAKKQKLCSDILKMMDDPIL